MASPKNESPEREGFLAAPEGKHPALQLMKDYEGVTGVPLQRLREPRQLEGHPVWMWPWNWSPEEVALFLSEWDRPIYLTHPLLRDLALTPSRDNRQHLYEQHCRESVKAAIANAQIVQNAPLGSIPPLPVGEFSYDTSMAPPGIRPTWITINFWTFAPKLHTKLPKNLRDQIAEIHGRWMAEGMRVFNPYDHPTMDLGAVRQ